MLNIVFKDSFGNMNIRTQKLSLSFLHFTFFSCSYYSFKFQLAKKNSLFAEQHSTCYVKFLVPLHWALQQIWQLTHWKSNLVQVQSLSEKKIEQRLKFTNTVQRLEFIKENKKVRKQENTLSTKKAIKKKRKKTRSGPRKR